MGKITAFPQGEAMFLSVVYVALQRILQLVSLLFQSVRRARFLPHVRHSPLTIRSLQGSRAARGLGFRDVMIMSDNPIRSKSGRGMRRALPQAVARRSEQRTKIRLVMSKGSE